MKEFDTETFRMVLHDDLIKEFIVKKDCELRETDVRMSLRLTAQHYPGVKFFVLIEGEAGAAVSHDARRLAASPEYSRHTAALALHSKNVLMAIAGNLFLKINRPKVPTRFFDDREKALDWLRVMMREAAPMERS
jgi:hypothetical protein